MPGAGPGAGAGPFPRAWAVCVLSQVRDPGNAGTVLRAADAAGADLVVVSTESVDVWSPKVVRSSAGSIFHVPVVTGIPTSVAVRSLRTAGLAVLAADSRGERRLSEVDLNRPHAWVLGNEAWGMTPTCLGVVTRRFGCPSTGRPSRSTSPWRPRSAFTPRPNIWTPGTRSVGRGRSASLRSPNVAIRHWQSGNALGGGPTGGGMPMDSVQAVSEMLPDGLVVVDEHQVIRFANRRAEEILQLPRERLVGHPIREGMPLTDSDGNNWWDLTDPWVGLATRKGHREKLLWNLENGVEVLVTARYIRRGRGAPVHRVVMAFRDALPASAPRRTTRR